MLSRARRALAAAPILLSVCPAAGQTRTDIELDATRTAVEEASRRFGVPVNWIWLVTRAESGGDARAVSPAGAMGLMQIMPATYAELRQRYGLGPDAFAVRDNILAGAAYLRELHDRYGSYGMLAAYNAGPSRWEEYLATGRSLPNETQRYLARLSPAIAPDTAGVSPPQRRMPQPSPFAAPIFVVRTTTALPTVDAVPRTDATAGARLVGGVEAPHADVARPVLPRSGTLFVTSASR